MRSSHDNIVVVLSDSCWVVTGSHNLGCKASYENDQNLLILRGNRGLAEAYATHVMDIYGHYRWRYTVQKHGIHAGSGLETKTLGRTNTSSLVLPAKKWSCGTGGAQAAYLTRACGAVLRTTRSLTGAAFRCPVCYLRAPATRLEFSAVSAYYPASGNSR